VPSASTDIAAASFPWEGTAVGLLLQQPVVAPPLMIGLNWGMSA
jgi:hypothetical protein